jgi:ABC-type uncharacterized transport system ATPase subunit
MSGIDAHDEFALWVIRNVQLHRNSALRWRAIWQQTHDLGRSYDVRPNNPDLNLGSLSGGNQQKVVMAKWLQSSPLWWLAIVIWRGVSTPIGAIEH